MTIGLRELPIITAEYGTSLDPARWSTAWPLRPISASIGVLAEGGEAIIEETFGATVRPGDRVNYTSEPRWTDASRGVLVRLLKQDPAGSISRDIPEIDVKYLRMTPFWWGVLRGASRRLITGAASTNRWRCDSLWGLLRDLRLTSFPARSDVGSAVRFGGCPVINGTRAGNCSLTDMAVGYRLCRALDERPYPDATLWTARRLVETLLALAADPTWCFPPGTAAIGLDWRLGSGGSLLEWTMPSMRLEGHSIASALEEIIDHRRGLSVRYRVEETTVFLDIVSISPVQIAGNGITIPAATGTPIAVPAASALPFLEGPIVAADTGTWDGIALLGDRPLVGMTIHYAPGDAICACIPDGWALGDEPTDAPGNPTWRRWRINPAWPLDQFGHIDKGLRAPINLDGDRAWGGGWALPGMHSLEIDRLLPWDSRWSLAGANKDQPGFPHIFVREGASTTAWRELDLQLTVVNDPPGIELRLDAAGARRLRDRVGSQGVLAFTVGIREWAPIQVAWIRPEAQRPKVGLRLLPIPQHDCQQWLGLQGSIIGVDKTTGMAILSTADVYTIDDTVTLRQRLPLYRARHEVPGAVVTWKEHGLIDLTRKPGDFIPSVSTAPPTPINTFISHIDWAFTLEDAGTTWSTERPETDGELLV